MVLLLCLATAAHAQPTASPIPRTALCWLPAPCVGNCLAVTGWRVLLAGLPVLDIAPVDTTPHPTIASALCAWLPWWLRTDQPAVQLAALCDGAVCSDASNEWPTRTATVTPTATRTSTATPTETAVPTWTRQPTYTYYPTPTLTETPPLTATPSMTATATETQTSLPTRPRPVVVCIGTDCVQVAP